MLEEVNSSQIFTDEQPRTLEVTLAEFDELVEDKRALDRLLENEDFKRIILDKYIEEDGARLGELLMSRNQQVVKDRDIIVNKIVGKGYLKDFLKDMVNVLNGIDNPEQRVELIRQYRELEEAEAEERERLNTEGATDESNSN